MMDYDGNNSYEGSFDSGDDGPNVRSSIGGKIDANSLNTESDCSDLSDDEETLYRDDRTERTMRTIKTLRVPEGGVSAGLHLTMGGGSAASAMRITGGTKLRRRGMRLIWRFGILPMPLGLR